MRKRGSRSRWRRGAALAVASALLAVAAGCGGDSGGDGTVTLRMSWWGSDSRHKLTQELIKAFEKEHPNIQVEGEFTGWEDYWDRLATNAAGNNLPDVMQQETRYIREYADRNALLDLGEYMPNVIDPADFDPAIGSTGEVDGKTFAIPTGANAFSVIADPTIFKQAGVALPDDKKWTWQQFIDIAARITRGTPDGVFGLQNIGFVDAGLEILARQNGETIFKENGEIGVSQQTLVEWFELILRSRDTGAEPRPSRSIEVENGGVDQSLLATGKGAMGTWWTNELPTLSESAGHELRLLRLPGKQGDSGMFLKPAMFWSASARTEHPEEAATFINWLVNSPTSIEIQLADRGMPVNLKLRKQILDQLEAADKQSAEFLAEITPELAPPPALPPPGAGEVETILIQLNEQLLFNQITPEEAARQFRQQAAAAVQ